MAVQLRVFWCIDMEDLDADARALHDYVERVSVDDVCDATVDKTGKRAAWERLRVTIFSMLVGATAKRARLSRTAYARSPLFPDRQLVHAFGAIVVEHSHVFV